MRRNKDMAKINENKPIKVRGSDLKNAIFPLNIDRKSKVDPLKPTGVRTKQTVCFTIFGQHDELVDIEGNKIENGFPCTEDKEKEMAKIIYVNPPKYYVKVDSSGMLYNPMGLYEEGLLNKDLKYKKQWDYREVNKKVFNLYINFLKTKNQAWLTSANREMF